MKAGPKPPPTPTPTLREQRTGGWEVLRMPPPWGQSLLGSLRGPQAWCPTPSRPRKASTSITVRNCPPFLSSISPTALKRAWVVCCPNSPAHSKATKSPKAPGSRPFSPEPPPQFPGSAPHPSPILVSTSARRPRIPPSLFQQISTATPRPPQIKAPPLLLLHGLHRPDPFP